MSLTAPGGLGTSAQLSTHAHARLSAKMPTSTGHPGTALCEFLCRRHRLVLLPSAMAATILLRFPLQTASIRERSNGHLEHCAGSSGRSFCQMSSHMPCSFGSSLHPHYKKLHKGRRWPPCSSLEKPRHDGHRLANRHGLSSEGTPCSQLLNRFNAKPMHIGSNFNCACVARCSPALRQSYQ